MEAVSLIIDKRRSGAAEKRRHLKGKVKHKDK